MGFTGGFDSGCRRFLLGDCKFIIQGKLFRQRFTQITIVITPAEWRVLS